MAIWRSFIAEKAIPYGDHLLLKKAMAIWRQAIAKCLRAILQ
jgi:hypothetical protein